METENTTTSTETTTHKQAMNNATYVERKGKEELCPICQGTDVEGGFVEIQGSRAIQEVSCPDCEADWEDVYVLSGYRL